MSNTVIKVENLSKQYRLGTVGTGSLAHDLNRLWCLMRGKEDPYLKIGEVNNRSEKGSSEYVWALRDICFEVQQGEVLGIIGRNGAGKSTLLKILSRTTAPTTGHIKIRGRVASLLEVGTGFHPELSGRDNIYLNGAILGMTRREITRKFDEIVDFAGVERYIDTPVKRYSSGMYVRLAFAVAAHLEPEILIVDEVLAVGDAEFQKKCLGKMKDVSENDGRTILFVSHNMAAVKQLCNEGILLQNGKLFYEGDIKHVTEKYLQIGITAARENTWVNEDGPGNDKVRITRVAAYAQNKSTTDQIKSSDDIEVLIEFKNFEDHVDMDVTWDIMDTDTLHICHVGSLIGNGEKIMQGLYSVKFIIPGNLLNTKRYYFNVQFGADQRYVLYKHEAILSIDVEDDIQRQGASFHSYPGVIHPKFHFETKRLSS